jgi:hypothetical protein
VRRVEQAGREEREQRNRMNCCQDRATFVHIHTHNHNRADVLQQFIHNTVRVIRCLHAVPTAQLSRGDGGMCVVTRFRVSGVRGGWENILEKIPSVSPRIFSSTRV